MDKKFLEVTPEFQVVYCFSQFAWKKFVAPWIKFDVIIFTSINIFSKPNAAGKRKKKKEKSHV